MQSDHSISIADNAILDASGGYVTYEGGTVASSMVLTDSGIKDISGVGRDEQVLAVFPLLEKQTETTSSKWGKRATNPVFPLVNVYRSPEYREGFAAGSISLAAPNQQLGQHSQLLLNTQIGRYQRQQAPNGGALNINLAISSSGTSTVTDALILDDDFGDKLVNEDLKDAFKLHTDVIERSSAGQFVLKTSGVIRQYAGTDLELTGGDSIRLEGAGVNLAGNIRAVGGDIDLLATSQTVVADEGIGQLVASGTLDSSGGWLNDSPGLVIETNEVVAIDAGNITLDSAAELITTSGSSLLANAGAWLQQDGNVAIGRAGTIDLQAPVGDDIGAARIDLQGRVQALDTGSGGLLKVAAENITIAGDVASSLVNDMVLGSSFFQQAEVGHFDLTARDGNILFTKDARVDLVQRQLQLKNAVARVGSSSDSHEIFDTIVAAEFLEKPGSLKFTALRNQVDDPNAGQLITEAGSLISATAGSTVEFNANNNISFGGTIDIAGGTVTATLSQLDTEDSTFANKISVEDSAVFNLNAGAAVLPQVDQQQLLEIYEAGNLNLTANFGFVQVNAGAEINLKGGRFTERRFVRGVGGDELAFVTTPVAGGSFNLQAERGFVNATRINFGDALSGFEGGEQSYHLTANAEGRNKGPAPDLIPLNVKLGAELPTEMAGIVGGGFILEENLSSRNNRVLRINVDNAEDQEGNPVEVAKIEVDDDLDLYASQAVILDTAALDLGDNQLEVNSSYVQLGETSAREAAKETTPISGGDGELAVSARLIDFFGDFNLAGDRLVNLQADHGVRFRNTHRPTQTEANTRQLDTNQLSVNGDLLIQAPAMWAETLVDYTVNSGGDFIFNQRGSNEEPPLSFAGKLVVNADNIAINSRIHNPFGIIELNAVDELRLGEDSVLSVGPVAAVPFGRILTDEFWVYDSGNSELKEIYSILPEKSIQLSADSLIAKAGSQQDLSGGGLVYGREFIAGLGGTADILADAHYRDMFAIVPTYRSGFSAYDVVEFGLDQPTASSRANNIPWGQQFEVAGSSQLADGRYTVLPANYALLPGAKLVSAASSAVIGKGYRSYDLKGAEVVSGRFIGASSQVASPWLGFAIEPNSVIDKRARYKLSSADDFFAGSAVGGRPGDNARLALKAQQVLDFQGTALLSPNSATGVRLDILSDNNIRIGQERQGNELLVAAELFDRIGANSITLGGEREASAEGFQLKAASGEVIIEDDIAADELVITARNTIRIQGNSTVSAPGNATFSGNRYIADKQGVSLLASNSTSSRLSATSDSNLDGQLIIEDGSSIQSTQSLGLAYDGSSSLANIDTEGTSLQLAAKDFVVGDSGDANLAASQINQANDLTLQATEAIRFENNVDLTNQATTLKATSIQLDDGVNVAIESAEAIRLQGQLAQGNNDTAPGNSQNSSLHLNADLVELGQTGEQQSRLNIDASQVGINARDAVLAQGDLQLATSGSVAITAPLITGGNEASLGLTAKELNFNNTAATAASDALAANLGSAVSFDFEADQIAVNTELLARSGLIKLQSNVADIILGEQAMLDVSPQVATFHETRSADAGEIAIHSAEDIAVSDIRSFKLGIGGADDRSQGGRLELKVQNEIRFNTNGQPLANGDWGQGNELVLEASGLTTDNKNAIEHLNQHGFDRLLSLTVTGDNENLVVESGRSLVADQLALNAERGKLTVAGNLQATAARDDVVLYGTHGVNLTDTAQIVVNAAEGKQLDLALQAPKGAVDVAAEASLQIDGGLEVVKAEQDLTTRVRLNGNDQLASSDSAKLYLARSTQANTVTKAQLQTDLDQLIVTVDGTNGQDYISGAGSVQVLPLLDVYTAGELDVNGLDLLGVRTAAGLPGRIQLRAGGDINLNEGLSDGVGLANVPPFLSPIPLAYLASDDSWDLVVSAGAGSEQLNGQVEFTGNGALRMQDGAFIRTGTGNIQVRTAGGLQQGQGSYIAAFGKAEHVAEPLPAFLDSNGQPLTQLPGINGLSYSKLAAILTGFSGFGEQGGNVDLSIGGNFTGTADGQIAPIQRATEDSLDFSIANFTGFRNWFLAINEIQGGVLASGGGDVTVRANSHIDKVGFATPGQGVGLDNSQAVHRIAGGDLTVVSQGDITRSNFQVDGADLQVKALGDIGRSQDSQGTLLTLSDASFELQSGGDLTIDAIVNTMMAPISEAQGSANPSVPKPANEIAAFYFDGYDTTSGRLSSTAGDVAYTADIDALKQTYGQPYQRFFVADKRFAILPSRTELVAYKGGISLTGIDNSLTIFPSAQANVNLLASGDITANSDPFQPFKLYLPDFEATRLPGISNILQTESLVLDTNAPIASPLDPALHSADLIKRDPADIARIYSANGNIGSLDGMQFILPKQVDAFAGGDIFSTTFKLQHSDAGAISQIRALGDIRFPARLGKNGVLVAGGQQLLEVAGPGDLIVTAGGDIDLGAALGIQTIGNLENSALGTQGSNIHVYAGFNNQGNLKALIGEGLNNSLVEQFDINALAGDEAAEILIERVAQATGKQYLGDDQTLNSANLNRAAGLAKADYNQLSDSLKLRVAIAVHKDLALQNPGELVSGAELLFAQLETGSVGLRGEQRAQVFKQYMQSVGGLLALDYLLTPARQQEFLNHAGKTVAEFSALPAQQQVAAAINFFDQADSPRRLLIAEHALVEQVRQSGKEGGLAASNLFQFERGMVAQNLFFGPDFDYTKRLAQQRAAAIQAGSVEGVDELKLDVNEQLNSYEAVIAAFENDSGTDFTVDPNAEPKGNIRQVFSAVRALASGNINIFAPNGSVDVGLSKSQLEALEISKDASELGILTFGNGDINAAVAKDFNVNESRTIPLAGGDLSVWSTAGDVDAGRGARNVSEKPPVQFSVNKDSGNIVITRPPAVSGSGITTSASRNLSNQDLSDEQRFDQVAEGEGGAVLATPLGFVDAGEAGIRIAGDLFLAAQAVQGADNIDAGGASVGVPAASSVDSAVAGVGSAAAAATSSAQESSSSQAEADSTNKASALVTVELLGSSSDIEESEQGLERLPTDKQNEQDYNSTRRDPEIDQLPKVSQL